MPFTATNIAPPESLVKQAASPLTPSRTASSPSLDLKENNAPIPFSKQTCPSPVFLRGVCEHFTKRWLELPCKIRSCPVCGERRRQLVSLRIAYGLSKLGGDQGGGWFVGTWDHDVDKPAAKKVLQHFVRWIRKGEKERNTGRGEDPRSVPWIHQPQPDLQYAATWERTRNERLHVNLIMSPWYFRSQGSLAEAWHRFGGGRMVWIERVGSAIGAEAAKSRGELSHYVSKFDQMVPTGKAVTYSKGWPKLPAFTHSERNGDIFWAWLSPEMEEVHDFEQLRSLGWFKPIGTIEYRSTDAEICECFAFKSEV